MKRRLAYFAQLSGLLLVLLAACHGSDPTTGTTAVRGQVVQYQTTKGVPHATVQLYHASAGGGYLPVGAGYPADASGHFAFAFEAESKSGYLLLAAAPPGYVTDWALAPALTAGHANEGILIPTYAPAWVKLQLVDEPPRSRVSMYISGYNGPGDRVNYPRDTTFIRPCTASFSSKIIATITDAPTGVDVQKSQDVKLAALDTVIVRIPF